MNGLKKGVTQAAIAAMLIASLSACSSNQEEPASSQSPSAGAEATASATANATASAQASEQAAEGIPGMKDGKFDPPVTITTARWVTTSTKFKDGETIEDNVHTRWMKDKLGIEVKQLWTTGDQEGYGTKLRLSMASGQPLPDVFFETSTVLQGELMQSGKVMDISEAFEQYASPRVKELYAKYPETLKAFTKDGKLMALPVLKDGDGTDSIMWIRQDWLDKLQLQAPTTIEELDKVMDAFVNRDPDGDGKKNTIGLSISLKNGLSSWMSEGSWIAGAYGDFLPGSWGKAEDGSLVYGGIQPNVKQAVGTLAEWYKKGYLDSEAGIIDEVKASESFVNGKSGILVGPSWSYGWPLADTLKNVPEADIQPIKLPAGPNGDVGRRGINPYEGVLFFNKDFKHMDAFFYYLDKLYDRAFEVKGSDFFYGYHEGYDYALKDGKPVYGKDNIGGDYTPGHYLLTAQEPLVPFDGLELLKKVMTEGYAPGPDAPPSELKLASADKHNLMGKMLVKEQFDSRIVNQFNSPPTKTMESKNELLNKMELETLTKIVFNREPVDYFDTFVANWKKSGGDAITTEVNEWYRSTGN